MVNEIIRIPNSVKELENAKHSHEVNIEDTNEWYANRLADIDTYYPMEDEIKRRERIEQYDKEYVSRLNMFNKKYEKNIEEIKNKSDYNIDNITVQKLIYMGPSKKYKDIMLGLPYFVVSDGKNYNIYKTYELTNLLDIDFDESEWKEYVNNILI